MKKMIFIISSLLIFTLPLIPQENSLDDYYAYPVSAGVHYQQLAPIANTPLKDFVISEFSGEVRLSLPGLPMVQPLIRLGMTEYLFTGSIDVFNQDWTHSRLFFCPGIGYSSRIAKEFEFGADLFAGISQSYFTKLSLGESSETKGQMNLLARLTGRLALNPSFNLSISVTPALNFSYAMGPLHDYDGFTFGVGFSGSYRFGDDPDAPQSTLKAIRFNDISLPPLFAAMQSYYVKNPAGTLIISNKESYPLDDVTVSFLQPGYMDSATPVAREFSMEPGETREIPITLSFNNQVFTTQGITPLTGEVIVTYSARGRNSEQRQSVTYDLHDKNALIWNDDRKAAAFITSQDSAVRNYSSYIRQIHRNDVNPYLSPNLQFAVQVFNALDELGILYQIDPTAPFTEMKGDTLVVDSVSLPRETLKRLTGDCDDLTVLFCTLLESIGIDTAMITVPGHIYAAFNSGVSTANYKMLNPDRSKTIALGGELWVPVEITMIGRASFTEAWDKGISQYLEWEHKPSLRGVYGVSEAQGLYRPVMLTETDLGLQYGDAEAITASFRKDLETIATQILNPQKAEAEAKGSPRSWNAYGVAAAKTGAMGTAEKAFQEAVNLNQNYISAKMNLGALYFLKERYTEALKVYQGIEAMAGQLNLPDRSLFNLYLNLSKICHSLERADETNRYYLMAQTLNPDIAEEFAYLGKETSTRASDGYTGTPIIFEE